MSHRKLSDVAFINQLSNLSLDPVLFTHEAHIRLAWLLLKSPEYDALVDIPRLIQNYTAHLGAEDKYHHTVTVAAIKVVDNFMRKSEATDFREFIKENAQLLSNFKELLAKHYSFDLFTHSEAKKIYLTPDLSPF